MEDRLGREALPATGGGDPLKALKPKGVTGMKQGWNGVERNKASRG